MYKCDVCGRRSDTKVAAGRWVFYCVDNKDCHQVDINHMYENELIPAMIDGVAPDDEVLKNFI